jgi:preprotein translocase subunit SecG
MGKRTGGMYMQRVTLILGVVLICLLTLSCAGSEKAGKNSAEAVFAVR